MNVDGTEAPKNEWRPFDIPFIVGDPMGRCMALVLDHSAQKINFEITSCEESLPILCRSPAYHEGEFRTTDTQGLRRLKLI